MLRSRKINPVTNKPFQSKKEYYNWYYSVPENRSRRAKLQKLRNQTAENIEKSRKASLSWYYRNKERSKQYIYNRRKTDICYLIAHNLRARLGSLIKKGSSVKDLGCSVLEFKLYIESLFKNGMTWANYGFYGWHLDHIKPLSLFNLADPIQFKQACHYSNLQPLWAKENLTKSAKYVEV